MNNFKDQFGLNLGYILELYERYLENPESVDAATRESFERWSPMEALPPQEFEPVYRETAGFAPWKAAAVVNLAHAIRSYGHLAAQLNPLSSTSPDDSLFRPESYQLTGEDLDRLPGDIVGGPASQEAGNAAAAIQILRAVYTNKIGYEYGHIQVVEERDWLSEAAETGRFRPPKDPMSPLALLDRLAQVEALDRFLHRIFPGKTRFSIEGVDMLVPMLDELIGCAAESGMCLVLIGMAHRGRLNVLAHILGKPYAQIFAEFRDPVAHFSTRDELGWTGDVKYHKGARRAVEGEELVQLVVSMAPNPSHLEHVDPVITGMARAAGTKADQPGPPQFFPSASLPVLIHGDASFTGQGVVAETLNLSRLAGYSVKGTIHIITNNQLGYTATPEEERSTLYASDLAKGFEIPIIHVNADDPVGCIEAIRTAFAYRETFQKDMLIDLIGYRRYGHNEGDEPSFTQPVMYQIIEDHPRVREIWEAKLVEQGLLDSPHSEDLIQENFNKLQAVLQELEPEEAIKEPELPPPPRGAARKVKTGFPLGELKEINQALLRVPQGFNLNRKLSRAMGRRRAIFDQDDERTVEWATAEELAFATILADGIPIRLTGEDVERGTFSQRHAVFFDTETNERFIPLQSFPQAKSSFEVSNSPLSENAVLGFEFGYNITAPEQLVIWEAQYGDFINTAQAMIDEFILSARPKWEQTPSLVLLLPHGHEGQGPDHSSARPERFLQLAAETNLRLANCTTAAQYFHLLRRQAALLKTDPLPLIVLTPKSLLRHPLVASSPLELAEGVWNPVLDDPWEELNPDQVERIIFCSGKIYVDLVSHEERRQRPEIAILRLEQLYPFPKDAIQDTLERYSNIEEIFWVQEEPANMGAWSFVSPRLEELMNHRWPLFYIGRTPNASPAEGSSARHAVQQKRLIAQALARERLGIKEA